MLGCNSIECNSIERDSVERSNIYPNLNATPLNEVPLSDQQYRELPENEKDAKRQYQRDIYHNMTVEKKKRLK